MVDIFVGSFETPFLRVLQEISRHIFMDELLKVQSQACAQSSNNNIRADARFKWHVAIGITQHVISWIIVQRLADLFPRRGRNACRVPLLSSAQRKAQ